jgi:hypothetical protein
MMLMLVIKVRLPSHLNAGIYLYLYVVICIAAAHTYMILNLWENVLFQLKCVRKIELHALALKKVFHSF